MIVLLITRVDIPLVILLSFSASYLGEYFYKQLTT